MDIINIRTNVVLNGYTRHMLSKWPQQQWKSYSTLSNWIYSYYGHTVSSYFKASTGIHTYGIVHIFTEW